jgi:hypothetical protein
VLPAGADPVSVWTEVWRQVERADDGSGWWQLARLSHSQDDPAVWELETSTRASVVPTTLALSTDDVRRLLDALGREVTR